MGLDTVELIVEFEKFFQIDIPNREAEKMTTVRQATDTIARLLHISATEAPLRDHYFGLIQSALSAHTPDKPFTLSANIAPYLSAGDEERWKKLDSTLGLPVHRAAMRQSAPAKSSWWRKHIMVWLPAYDWNNITVDDFILAFCASQYARILRKEKITNYYEILVAVTGITVNKAGVDYYEVSPDSSFTSDLGLD